MSSPSQLWCIPSELQAQSTSPLAQEACQSASFLLWALSGRKFTGYTTVTETYDYPESSDTGYSYFILNYEGKISTRLRLRGKPVVVVTEVRDTALDEVIDPTAYRVDDHSVIRFDYALSHSMDVTYTYGGNVPIAGKMAARMLAMEFVKLWNDDDDCMLPSRVTTITRQNVSMTILDRQDFIADLRTGVYAVDLFLKSVNPYKATQRAKVFSPDIPRGRRKSQ
jgi:hypothetical protein